MYTREHNSHQKIRAIFLEDTGFEYLNRALKVREGFTSQRQRERNSDKETSSEGL